MAFMIHPPEKQYCHQQSKYHPDHRVSLPHHPPGSVEIFRKVHGTRIQPGTVIRETPKISSKEEEYNKSNNCQVPGPPFFVTGRVKRGELREHTNYHNRQNDDGDPPQVILYSHQEGW